MIHWTPLYRFSKAIDRIQRIQTATTTTEEFGIVPDPHLFGSPEWWESIEKGEKKVFHLSGEITRIHTGGVGDWPEFEMIDDQGNYRTWAKEGDKRRYVEGLKIRIQYVEYQNRYDHSTGNHILEIDIEESDKRSSSAPLGLQNDIQKLFGGPGTFIHYFFFKNENAAKAFAGVFGNSKNVKISPLEQREDLFVSLIDAPENWQDELNRIREVKNAASELGGLYDGSELITEQSPKLFFPTVV